MFLGRHFCVSSKPVPAPQCLLGYCFHRSHNYSAVYFQVCGRAGRGRWEYCKLNHCKADNAQEMQPFYLNTPRTFASIQFMFRVLKKLILTMFARVLVSFMEEKIFEVHSLPLLKGLYQIMFSITYMRERENMDFQSQHIWIQDIKLGLHKTNVTWIKRKFIYIPKLPVSLSRSMNNDSCNSQDHGNN